MCQPLPRQGCYSVADVTLVKYSLRYSVTGVVLVHTSFCNSCYLGQLLLSDRRYVGKAQPTLFCNSCYLGQLLFSDRRYVGKAQPTLLCNSCYLGQLLLCDSHNFGTLFVFALYTAISFDRHYSVTVIVFGRVVTWIKSLFWCSRYLDTVIIFGTVVNLDTVIILVQSLLGYSHYFGTVLTRTQSLFLVQSLLGHSHTCRGHKRAKAVVL